MKSQKTLGIVFLVVGVLFLADTLDWFDIGDIISTWWPLILILVGLRRLAVPSASHGGAWMLIIIGGAFQLAQLNILAFDQIFRYWPVLLIAFGLYLVLTGGRPSFLSSHFSGTAASGEDVINVFSMFGGSIRVNSSSNFKGGSVSALMGGFEIDLTHATPVPEGAVLDITAIMGGGKITVPAAWRISISSLPIMGSVHHEKIAPGQQLADDAPRLQIHATTIMGGVTVKPV